MSAQTRILSTLLIAATAVACSGDAGRLPLVVDVQGRSMTKLPFVMAMDQGLYEKHGLDVELRLPTEEEPGPTPGFWGELWATAMSRYPSVGRRLGLLPPEVDIVVQGHTPTIVELSRGVRYRIWVAIAATDCKVHSYVVGSPGVTSLDQLKGKRLGTNYDMSTVGFGAVSLIQRMGWERDRDIELVVGASWDELRNGSVDAIVSGSSAVARAEAEGYPILEDTRTWNAVLAGNSAMVAPGWLDDATNREAARRFLMAAVEALAMFHNEPEVASMRSWSGGTGSVIVRKPN